MTATSQLDKAIFTQISMVIGGRKSPKHIKFNCQQAFQGVDLCDKSVLEIGAGEGILSAYAATHGAKYVVALEPGAAGSNGGSASTIQLIKQKLRVSNLEISDGMIQNYDSGGRKFDIALLWNSVNHLDEPFCEQLKHSSHAVDVYRRIFRHISSMMGVGALLIVADCSRYNLYPMLGLRHPIIPQIEWEKHQSVRTWLQLLEPLGFVKRHLSWTVPYPLRLFAPLLNNSIAAFLLCSHFRIILSYDTQ
jgi:hypothetical protein